jgi:hypothetical protein
MGTQIADGLYRIDWKNACAGFIVKDGVIIRRAPILKNWMPETLKRWGVLVKEDSHNNDVSV